MVRKTNVRQHTRRVKGRPVNVIRHERRVQEQLGRVGKMTLPKREPLADELIKSTVSFPTALFREPPKKEDLVDSIIAYEQDELGMKEEIELFSKLVKNGQAWTLQGHYGRTAKQLIEAGYLDSQGNILNKAKSMPKKKIQVEPFMKQQLTELDVHLLSRRMNDGKITEEEAIAIMPRDGWDLEADQVEKGRKWLNNIWKNRYGIVKQSSPFEHKQEAALQSFRTAKLVGMESDDGSYFYPRYRIIGTNGQFDYSVKGGNIKFY